MTASWRRRPPYSRDPAATDCLRSILDLICYEMHRGTLSRESLGMFADHLEECAACKTRVEGFRKLLLQAGGASR